MAEAINVTVDDSQETVTAVLGTGITAAERAAITANTAKVTNEVPVSDTGTVLDLSKTIGTLYNMAAANTATTYTTTGTTLNAYARVLINAASEPTVTGATKIKGSDFVISTNQYMTVWNNGTTVQFWFEDIAL